MPNGADVLVHLRRCLEFVSDRSDMPFVALDLDLRNAFPSLEWPSIRRAIEEHFPSLSAWTSWCHRGDSQVLLPSGEWYSCDRGAEQGDPLGPVYCAAVLIRVAAQARAAVESEGGWVWDCWFMDDGQVFLPPQSARVYLAAFDAALAEVGGTRVADGEFKSVARLCGSVSARAMAPATWADGVRETCKIVEAAPAKVLGVGIDGSSLHSQFESVAGAVKSACGALPQVNDPAAELALLRVSMNACRVSHLLRAAGPELSVASIADFDEVVESALATTLGGPIVGLALERATCGAKDGGLGLRRGVEVRLPAFIASRTESRGVALALAGTLPEDLRTAVFDRWDAQVTDAVRQWEEEIPPGAYSVAKQVLSDATAASERVVWRLEGSRSHRGLPPASSREQLEHSLLSPLGSDDVEHPSQSAGNLQTRLCDFSCARKLAAVESTLEASNDQAGLHLLHDLRSPDTDHSWLWMLATPSGDEVRGQEFCVAVRLRIGADVVEPGTPCKCCGAPMDARGLHASRCAPGDSTRGHNRVANTLHCLASLSDSSSSVEPRGLVASRPALRPADVLTSAAFARAAALDVSIVSPDAVGAGSDPCEAAVRRKLAKYGPILDELREVGIDYRPVTWSCWGRPDASSTAVIRSMACAAARRRGFDSPDRLVERTHALIGAQIWRRAAAMVISCLGFASQDAVEDALPFADPLCEDDASGEEDTEPPQPSQQ